MPIVRDEAHRDAVMAACEVLEQRIAALRWQDEPVRVRLDRRDLPTPDKRWEWVRKGVPFIVELGPKDLEKGSIAVTDRLALDAKKSFPPVEEFLAGLTQALDRHDRTLFDEVLAFQRARTRDDIATLTEFRAFFAEDGAGFVRAWWSEDESSLEKIEDLGVSVRCLPYEQPDGEGRCVLTGAPAKRRAIFAKSY
ncbi:MAG: hypothetical protein D6757_09250 [Alphaproteobacteria bacterium]|nr:MAG: hypothetical protein D6757_09250 [Alphaproteobacteria bacterium]